MDSSLEVGSPHSTNVVEMGLYWKENGNILALIECCFGLIWDFFVYVSNHDFASVSLRISVSGIETHFTLLKWVCMEQGNGIFYLISHGYTTTTYQWNRPYPYLVEVGGGFRKRLSSSDANQRVMERKNDRVENMTTNRKAMRAYRQEQQCQQHNVIT